MLTSPLLSGAGFSRNTTEMAAIRPAVFVSASCQPAREQGNRSNAVDGSTQSRNLSCLHCDFKCQLGSEMTQHRWQEHPLLMRRKQHLMSSSIVNRKRQLSETMVGQVSPHGKSESADADNCGKARKVKTDMCDVAEQAKQEGMDHTKATSEEVWTAGYLHYCVFEPFNNWALVTLYLRNIGETKFVTLCWLQARSNLDMKVETEQRFYLRGCKFTILLLNSIISISFAQNARCFASPNTAQCLRWIKVKFHGVSYEYLR